MLVLTSWFFFPLAVGNIDTNEGDQRALKELQVQLMDRKVWMASSIHKGEEKGNFLLIYNVFPCIKDFPWR